MWRWPTTTSSDEVKERVEVYLYYPSGPSWPVLGWTLPLTLPLDSRQIETVCLNSAKWRSLASLGTSPTVVVLPSSCLHLPRSNSRPVFGSCPNRNKTASNVLHNAVTTGLSRRSLLSEYQRFTLRGYTLRSHKSLKYRVPCVEYYEALNLQTTRDYVILLAGYGLRNKKTTLKH